METKITGKATRMIQLPHLLWNFLLQLALKWKFVLFIILIGTLAGAGYATLKNISEEKVNTSVSATVSVTGEEMGHVLSVAKAYDKIEVQRKYNEQSVWMKCRDMEKSVATAVFYLNTGDGNLNSQITDVYLNKFEGEDVYQKVAEDLGEEVEIQYLKEMLWYGRLDNIIFKITVTSWSQESAKAMLSSVKEYLDSCRGELEEQFAVDCEIKLLSEECTDVLDTGIRDRKQGAETTLVNLQTSYAEALETLTANERDYYDLYMNVRNSGDYALGQELTKDTAGAAAAVQNEFASLRLRTDTMLGLILGFCCACAVFIIRYCWSSRLVNGEELSRMYGIALMGTALSDRKRKKVESWILKKQKKTAKIKNFEGECREIVARLRLQFSENDKIYLSGTQVEQADYVQLLAEEGKKQGISFIEGKNILENSSDISEIREATAVLLIETEGVSEYHEIEKEICILRESGRNICGAVIIV